MDSGLRTPVLLLVFNRPNETKQVLDSIRKVRPAKLYVSADGPRLNNETDTACCTQVRSLVKESVDWDCELKLQFRNENLGCGGAPSNAYDWFFSQEEAGIILEDDCVASKSFFFYCSALLERYEDDERIFSINGNNFGYNLSSKDPYFIGRFMNPCGWATWRRSYQLVDYSLSKWETISFKTLFLHVRLNTTFDLDLGWIKYWKGIFTHTRNNSKNGIKVSYWDYQWMFAQLFYNKFSIIPAKNLISNIGYNQNGSHITDESDRLANLPSYELDFPLPEVKFKKLKLNDVFETDFVKKIWCYQKIRRGIYFYAKMTMAKWLGLQKKSI